MDQFHDWKNNLDRFFGQDFWNEFEGVIKPPIPAMNMYQYDNEVLCIFDIPGLDDAKKVDVYVEHASLTVKGMVEIDHRGGQQIKSELPQGVFERTITLPFAVRSDKIQATYRNGLLTIQLYRWISDKSKSQRVPIRYLED
ncbi:Hsp20/alpha crystallin family protein [Thalassobacillus sp. CUG 92003]|uniref:Hsp20/alpha crystallin family protein n=1 Tax=Thalassobacillus sp. CUG 92003 TaxID=2736641 RepID=UPI0015E69CBA|nr:Hsp20/alpha crystallin family protein [Thalassobacillus sp. CUG 92003]